MKSLKKTGRNHEIFQKIFELRLQVKSILSARGFLAKPKKKTLAPRMGTLQKSIVMCFTALLELPINQHVPKNYKGLTTSLCGQFGW